MKKATVLRAMSLALAVLASASPAQSQSSIGVRVGPTFSSFNGQGAFSFVRASQGLSLGGYNSGITNFSAGITYNQFFSTYFSLNTELIYARVGGDFEAANAINGTSVSLKEHIRLDYVQVPVLLRANLGGEVYQFYVGAGPYFGYGIGGSRRVTGDIAEEENSKGSSPYGNFEGSLNRFDLGIAIDGGFAFNCGPGRLGAELRLQQGLTNLTHNRKDVPGTDWNEAHFRRKNYIFCPAITYTFRLPD